MVAMFDKIRASRIFQTLMRVLQFLSAIISLGLFSRRLYTIYSLGQRAINSTGAVEGILAAAALYTLISTLVQCCLRNKHAPSFLRWLLIALDIAFVGAFIAVARLTSPNGGTSGSRGRQFCLTSAQRNRPANANKELCKFPIGTFITAIISTILHSLTAIFNEVRDHHHANKAHKSDGGHKSNEDAYAPA